ncbi:hypothetical protein [Anatilimnocola floriformis]|uniref:hypothetical protein n=1 Tax=Anatilimnocola floriformis TaxID=2948575 RepID=UPI0020C30BC9|nr:hypothetical protein [Anatilimnocola floriformis]
MPKMTTSVFASPGGLLLAAVSLLALATAATASHACPFCGPTAQTLTEEMASMDIVAIVKLLHIPPIDLGDTELAKAKFEIVHLIKGEAAAKVGDKIDLVYFGDGKVGSTFLIMGIDPPRVSWSTPIALSTRAKDYLDRLTKLPKSGDERLVFFQEFLEDEDTIISRDAFDEFAKAPYTEVKRLKPHMKHDQVMTWIQNTDIPASRRRLYLVMLGVCGSENDLPFLESCMKSNDRKARQGLDALIACYLTLKGESGMETVEDLYLKNKKSDYADTYSAIIALRFHGTESNVIEKKRIIQALRLMLKRPELADLVIPDLANWEDWTASDELFELFKTADERSTWVRVPVINYLRRNPTEHAKELLKECDKIDPAAVKRANTFFPGDPSPPVDPNKATKVMVQPRNAEGIAKDQAIAAAPEVPADVAAAPQAEEASVVNSGADPAQAILKNPIQAPNRWLLVGVPWGIGLALFVVQWCVLRGI